MADFPDAERKLPLGVFARPQWGGVDPNVFASVVADANNVWSKHSRSLRDALGKALLVYEAAGS